MNRKFIVSIFAVSALALGAIFGAVSYRNASAATATTTTSAPSDLRGPGMGHGGGEVTGTELAAALGVTVDQLNQANKDALTEALKQAVAKGLITQTQADDITSQGSTFALGGRWQSYLTENGIDFDALLAKALNITVDKLNAARQTAYYTRIDQAVTNGQMTQAQADLEKGEYALSHSTDFQSAMKSAYQSAIAQAVKNGVISQAQADAILANTNNWKGGFGGLGGFGGPGGHGGREGHGGPLDGTNLPAPSTTTP